MSVLHYSLNNDVEDIIFTEDVSRDELFVRKLVDATFIQGRLYEHIENEKNKDISTIYVLPDGDEDYYPLKQFLIVPNISIAYYVYSNKWTLLEHQQKDSFLEVAADLLHHAVVIKNRRFEVTYSIYHVEQKRVIILLEKEG